MMRGGMSIMWEPADRSRFSTFVAPSVMPRRYEERPNFAQKACLLFRRNILEMRNKEIFAVQLASP